MKTIIGYVNAIIYRASIKLHRLRYFLQKKLKLTKKYQPNPFDISDNSNIRDCLQRFSCIDEALPNRALSCLDIGCNEGFFVFKLSERGGFCLGIDSGRNEIMTANSIKSIHNVKNTVFTNLHLNSAELKNLPSFEVIIFLSVFHHLVKNNSLEYAKDFVSEISKINRKYLIFETGQPDEEGVAWSEVLSFMLPDINDWIIKMLQEAGYKNISIIGKNKSIRSNVKRSLFLASK